MFFDTAIHEGVDPVVAIQMVTLNVAEHYECARELGSIAPPRFADMLVLDDLKTAAVNTVIADGRVVSRNGKLLTQIQSPEYPSYVRNTVHFKKTPALDDLVITSKTEMGSVRVRAIGVIPGSIQTKHLQLEVPVRNKRLQAKPAEDLIKIAVFERHLGTGNKAVGFIQGLGIREGAVASTVAHDSHNLVLAGASDQDMILAASTLLESQGGLVVVRGGEILAHLPLPIAGLMSDQTIESVSQKVEQIRAAWIKLGSDLPSPYMTLSFTTLSVIPELRITDKGLLDTVQFRFVPNTID